MSHQYSLTCVRCYQPLHPAQRFCSRCGAPSTAQASPRVILSPGTIVGSRWQIVREVGKGSMGAVYLVQDTRLANRRAALKEMRDSQLTPEERAEAIDRFHREAETLAALRHPSIPHIYDRFAEGNQFYMAMEWIEGITLERLLQSYHAQHGQPPPEKVVARYAYHLCSVLDYLHTQSPPVLHRDLKPSNVMIQPDGVLKLVDFGISKTLLPATQGTSLGTHGYAAPEQYRGYADPLTDIYALGATLHHLLTGRDPQKETPFDFPPASQLASCSGDFSQLVASMVQLRSESRPRHADAIQQRLCEVFPDIKDWPEPVDTMKVLRAFINPPDENFPAPPVLKSPEGLSDFTSSGGHQPGSVVIPSSNRYGETPQWDAPHQPKVTVLPSGYVPSGFGIRLSAFALDALIMLFPFLWLVGVTDSVWWGVLLIAGYQIGFWSFRGQTPGKQALGLYVITRQGRPVRFGTAVLRWFGFLLSSLPLGLGFLNIAFDDLHRGLHDQVAGTLVVRRR